MADYNLETFLRTFSGTDLKDLALKITDEPARSRRGFKIRDGAIAELDRM